MAKRGFVNNISDEYSEDISDELLSSVFDASEEEETQYGGSLFEFEFQKSGFPQNWKNVVHKQRYRTTLRQKRNPRRGEDLGREITDALNR